MNTRFNLARVTKSRGHFNFNLDAFVHQSGNKHGCGWPGLAQVFFENWPTGFKIESVRQNVMDAYDIIEAAASLQQCFFDIF